VDQPHHGRELVQAEPQAPHQLAAGPGEHGVASGVELARRGRAMHAVQLGELIDAEAVERVLAEQPALARGERCDRCVKRLLELVAIQPLEGRSC
jgi:hypothetical protein